MAHAHIQCIALTATMVLSSQHENKQSRNALPKITEISAFKKSSRPAIIAAKIKLAQLGQNPDEYHAGVSARTVNTRNQRIVVIYCMHKDEYKPELENKIILGDACGKCFEMEYHIKSGKIINVHGVE